MYMSNVAENQANQYLFRYFIIKINKRGLTLFFFLILAKSMNQKDDTVHWLV